MSDFFVGPFGRTLHVADSPSSEQERERSANLSASSGNPRYQLPPPRGPEGGLPFGSDPFLHQRNHPASRRGSGIAQEPNRPVQQLPSVSQLLTNTPRSSPPSSYYPPGAPFTRVPGPPPPPPSHPFRHDHSQISPTALYDRAPGFAPPAGHLPPLSHAVQASGEHTPPRPVTGSNLTVQTQLSPLSYHGQIGTTKSLGEGSPSEISGASTATGSVPPVRPHVVDEKYIEGEGLCYIYADGSYCPKNIDGVPVNANWGITKAGKPRKRLAQACRTCREKKIKCHPNLPKCDQCQKSGRDCRFENGPRGHRSAFKASRYDAKDVSSSALSSGPFPSPYSAVKPSESSASLPGSGQSPVSDGSILTLSAVDSAQEGMTDQEQSYRARMQGLNIASVQDPKRPASMAESQLSPEYVDILMEIKEIDPDDLLANVWNADPYSVDPETTTHYMESYFSNVNDTLYHIFPRRRFSLWLQSAQVKSLEDKTLLYSILTLGTVFSDHPDRLIAMRRFSRTARYAVERSQHRLSLQLAQSRIILGLWYYAVGALVQSWDSIGSAMRIVCALRYNMESGGVIVDRNHVCEYGLHPQALMECRRRTFWTAYLLDRLTSFYSQSSIFIPSQFAFLRLPCIDETFEAQHYATVPYFQNLLNNIPLSPDEESVSPVSYWIEIVSHWGDVVQHVLRLPHIPTDSYNKIFDEFHTSTTRRLEGWVAKLPIGLAFTAGNLERSVRTRKADTFVSIHLLYHATLMKLNRHARYQSLPSATVNQYIHRTRHHAVEILRICTALGEHEPLRPVADPGRPVLTPLALNPFILYIIVSAVDVLSAFGMMTDLNECVHLIKSGRDTARRLCRFWDSSLPLVSLIDSRMNSMVACLQYPARLEGKVVFAMDCPSLDSRVGSSFSADNPSRPVHAEVSEDLMYEGLPKERLLGALGVEDASLAEEGHILWIKDAI